MKKQSKNQRFNLHAFLNTGGLGKKVVQYRNKQVVFSQGDQSSKVFYIQKGPRQAHGALQECEGSNRRDFERR